MIAPDDRLLFADGMIYRFGDWICVAEWLAHYSLSLPADWIDCACKPSPGMITQEGIDSYVEAARTGEPVRFNPPKVVRDNGVWNYQTVKGRAPLGINADVRRFFEDLTPGSKWVMTITGIRRNGSPVDSAMFARVHPLLGVRVLVAGSDPT